MGCSMTKRILIGVLLGALAVGGGMAEAKDKPLNAGKDGIKSNAGVGNGTEDYVAGVSTATTTNVVETTTTNTETGEPVIVSTTTSTTETGRTQVGDPVQVGKSSNFKINYSVTYEVATTTGTETTVTTETVLTTDVYKTTTTTTDMADRDPGNSQSHNKAPEGQPADIVVSDTVLDSTTSEVTGTTTDVISDSTTTTATTTGDESVVCNGSVGGNTGANYCN